MRRKLPRHNSVLQINNYQGSRFRIQRKTQVFLHICCACFIQRGNAYFAAASSSCHSASLSVTSAAFKFSSRCAIEDVPGIGSITGERCSSHASDNCETVAPCFLASSSSLPPGCASLPAATGNHG